MTHKAIRNEHFIKLKDIICSCIDNYIDCKSLISDIHNASFDDKNNEYVYPNNSEINLDTIKLDDITEYRKELIGLNKGCRFDPLSAVDAICINQQNEWFFIEFKNGAISDTKTMRSIKKKMIHSLWFIPFLYSKSGESLDELFSDDFSKFARENITYIIVGSQSKNKLYHANVQALESSGKHYTPPGFEQFIGYYFKDIYMLTELELRNFILNFQA